MSISGPLVSQEISAAEAYLLRQKQLVTYPDKMALFQPEPNSRQARTLLSKKSPLYQKLPWLDQKEVLRMTGHISNCDDTTLDTKHTAILPRDHPTTTKITIAHFLQKFHHQNHETLTNKSRHKYTIPKFRAAYANVPRTYQHCKNHLPVPKMPVMVDLSAAPLDALTKSFTRRPVSSSSDLKEPLLLTEQKSVGPLSIVVSKLPLNLWPKSRSNCTHPGRTSQLCNIEDNNSAAEIVVLDVRCETK